MRSLPRLLTVVLVCGWIFAAGRTGFVQAATAQRPANAASEPAFSPQPILNKYCVGRHNQKLRTAGLALDILSESDIAAHAGTWENVVRKLRTGAMPPPGAPRPDKTAGDALVSSLETALDEAAARHPNPGRTETFHRLNRTEYRHAIRDLLGLDIDMSSLLPADDADGFDNMASLLSISPALLERYMAAARKVSRLAIGLPPAGPVTDIYTVGDLATQIDYASEDLPFGSRGGLAIRHYFPVDGEYQFKVRLHRQIYDYVTGLDRPEQLEVRIDGERVKSFAIGGEDHGRTAPQSFGGDVLGSPEWEKYALSADKDLEVRRAVKAGLRVVGVSFVGNTISWHDPTVPVPMENNPRVVFERLFGDVGSTESRARLARLKRDRSILDSVTESAAALGRRVGPADRVRLDEYLGGVRDIETRIQKAEEQSAKELPAVIQPAGVPVSFEDYAKLMFDLQVLAYQCDLTRVITFMLGREFSGRSYPEIGVPDAHHPLSHHQYDPDKMALMAKVNTYHASLFAYYLEKLRATKEGDGSLLDHVLLMYGAGMSDSNSHDPRNLPIVLIGGAGQVKGGRHVKYAADPAANLLVTVVHKLGIDVEQVGTSRGALNVDVETLPGI